MLVLLSILLALHGPVDTTEEKFCLKRGKFKEQGTWYQIVRGKHKELFVYSSCKDSGYRLDQYRLVACVNGVPETALPKCEPIRRDSWCLPLEAPLYGVKSCSSPDLTVGTVCEFSCQSNYELSGSRERTCRPDLKWTGFPAQCSKFTETELIDKNSDTSLVSAPHSYCTPLTTPTYGSMNCSRLDSAFGTVCKFRCKDNVDLKGSTRRTCGRNGKWTGNFTRCVHKTARVLPAESPCARNNGGCAHRCHERGPSRCSCYDGYQLLGNGKSCGDVDECASGNFGCSQKCINFRGSARCGCNPGFELEDDGKTCRDIDECTDKTRNQCDQECRNTIGSYTCWCKAGYVSPDGLKCSVCRDDSYRGDGDPLCVDCPPHSRSGREVRTSIADCVCETGFSGDPANGVPCTDINECEVGNLGCSHLCTNTPGSAHCGCFPGFELQSDGRSCEDIDECSKNNGGCQGLCQNSKGSFYCLCMKGFTKSNEDKYFCEDINECDYANGGCSDLCVNFQGGHSCACRHGRRLADDGRNCIETRCPRPPIPPNSHLVCSEGPGGDKEEIRRGSTTESEDFPEGATCRLKCDRGYSTSSPRVAVECGGGGGWNGTLPHCAAGHCPSLVVPENGLVYPPECRLEEVPVTTRCSFYCSPGFRIVGAASAQCRRDGSWRGRDTTPMCVPDTPPYIVCEQDVEVTLPRGENSIFVQVGAPRTNAPFLRVVPEWATGGAPRPFPAGQTGVTFVGSYENGTSVNCTVRVNVKDDEPPFFETCPENIYVTSSVSHGSLVSWDEPLATDNVGVHLISTDLTPNTTLLPGIYFVEYQAEDEAGNSANCSFEIHITTGSDACGDLEDPEHGRANCEDWMFGRVCEPSCEPDHSRGPDEPTLFFCGESGEWTPPGRISPCLPDGPALAEHVQ